MDRLVPLALFPLLDSHLHPLFCHSERCGDGADPCSSALWDIAESALQLGGVGLLAQLWCWFWCRGAYWLHLGQCGLDGGHSSCFTPDPWQCQPESRGNLMISDFCGGEAFRLSHPHFLFSPLSEGRWAFPTACPAFGILPNSEEQHRPCFFRLPLLLRTVPFPPSPRS